MRTLQTPLVFALALAAEVRASLGKSWGAFAFFPPALSLSRLSSIPRFLNFNESVLASLPQNQFIHFARAGNQRDGGTLNPELSGGARNEGESG